MLSAMTTLFGSATPCKRAARFGVSPTMPAPANHPTDQIADHDQSRCDANARLQGRVGLQAAHSRDQLQPCAHRPLRIVLMGLRIAEIDEDAVAHILRHEAAEALHGLGDAFLIGRNDLAQVFRVHAGRECRRADQVREHHRDLAALGGRCVERES